MAKSRRTKQQKTAAHHNFQNELTIAFGDNQTRLTIPTAPTTSSHNQTQTTAIAAPSYSYVITDVRRTLFITSILIVLDLVIYFLLKTKFVSIPTVGF